MAFILSVPMRGIGKRLSRLMPKASERTINVLSLIITLLLLVAIIVLLCVIAIPQLIASVKSIISLIKEKWPDWAAVLRNYGFDTAEISAYLNKLDWKTIAEKAMNGAGVVIGSVVSVAGSTISTVVNAAVSLVIMFYVLVGKQELGKQTRRALYAYCKESVAPYRKAVSRYLCQISFRSMCRGADTWYADFPFVFYIPDPLCRADGGFDRSFCLCTIHWSVLVLCNRYVADFAG